MEKHRNLNLDLIRALSIMMVICIHGMGMLSDLVYSGNASWAIKLEFAILEIGNASVPMFLMLSGALLLGRDEPIGYFFKKRLTRILVPFFIWSTIVYALLYIEEGGRSLTQMLQCIVERTFTVKFYGILWYVYLITVIYLLTPALRLIARNRAVLGYTIVLLFASYYIHTFIPDLATAQYLNNPLFINIAHFLMGYYVAQYLQRESWLHSHRVAIFIAIFAVHAVLTFYNHQPLIKPLLATALYICLSTANLDWLDKLPKAKWAITQLSITSYGIYLTHFMLISLCVRTGVIYHIPVAIEPILLTLAVTCVNALAFYPISKTKFMRLLT